MSKQRELTAQPEVEQGFTAKQQFFIAVTDDNVNDLQKLLISGQIDPSVNDNQAIKSAAYYGSLEVLEVLLEDERVDPGAGDNYAIKQAVYYGHFEVFKLLVHNNKVDPSAGNNAALQYATHRGDLEVIGILLKSSTVIQSITKKQIEDIADVLVSSWRGRHGYTSGRCDNQMQIANNEQVKWYIRDGNFVQAIGLVNYLCGLAL